MAQPTSIAHRLQVTKAVLPGMLARKRGAIVNIGSAAATVAPSGPLYAVYAASKVWLSVCLKASDRVHARPCLNLVLLHLQALTGHPAGICGHVQQIPAVGVQLHRRAQPGPCLCGHQNEQDKEGDAGRSHAPSAGLPQPSSTSAMSPHNALIGESAALDAWSASLLACIASRFVNCCCGG